MGWPPPDRLDRRRRHHRCGYPAQRRQRRLDCGVDRLCRLAVAVRQAAAPATLDAATGWPSSAGRRPRTTTVAVLS